MRQVSKAGKFNAELAGQLGRFIAVLHRKGIHFHSLHLGNVLRCPDGTFGLIDISHMRIFPWPLWANTRMRNFIHLFRYPEDLQTLTVAGLRNFMDGYLEGQPAPRMEKALRSSCGRFL